MAFSLHQQMFITINAKPQSGIANDYNEENWKRDKDESTIWLYKVVNWR